jgi:hypothetical protein
LPAGAWLKTAAATAEDEKKQGFCDVKRAVLSAVDEKLPWRVVASRH